MVTRAVGDTFELGSQVYLVCEVTVVQGAWVRFSDSRTCYLDIDFKGAPVDMVLGQRVWLRRDGASYAFTTEDPERS